MKSILISIQPQWVQKILNEEKTIEVRKTAPEPPFKAYIYCTKGNENLIQWNDSAGGDGNYNSPQCIHFKCRELTNRKVDEKMGETLLNSKVVAEFICNKVSDLTEAIESAISDNYHAYNDIRLEKACLHIDDLSKYMQKGRHGAVGIHISDLKVYDKPKELGNFTGTCKTNKRCGESKICDSSQQCLWDKLTRPPQSWMYVEELL